jgi:hypothetical protein
MIDAITLSCYVGGRIDGIAAEFQYLRQLALVTADPMAPSPAALAACPDGRAITAATGLGVGEMLLDAARPEQPDGRIFAVLPAGHPGNRLARAAGWHEVLRSRSGMQLLVHPDHPALAPILLRA